MKKTRIFQEGSAKLPAGIEKPEKFGIGSGPDLQASPGNVNKQPILFSNGSRVGGPDREPSCDAFGGAVLYVLDDTEWAQLGVEAFALGYLRL